MNEVAAESRNVVYARPAYRPQVDGGSEEHTAVADYLQQLASSSLNEAQEDADQSSLFKFLTEQQPQLLTAVRQL